MKKTFVAIAIVSSLFLLSCASNNISQDSADAGIGDGIATEGKADVDTEGDNGAVAGIDTGAGVEIATGADTQGNADVATGADNEIEDFSTEPSNQADDMAEVGSDAQNDDDVLATTSENSSGLEEPGDFEEPLVITLPPKEIPTPNADSENSDKNTEEIPLPEEKVEIEDMPEVLEVENEVETGLTQEENSDQSQADDQNSTDDENQIQNAKTGDQESSDKTDENLAQNEVESEVESLEPANESTENSTDDVQEIGDDDDDDESELVVEEEEIIPSRKITMKKQEYLDITYPGKGWIYMGITDGTKDLTYYGRKLGTENTKFTLQAKNAGTKIVHFYKNDALTGNYIDDYLEIEILNEKGSNKTHIEAPEYKQTSPKKAEKTVVEPAVESETTDTPATSINTPATSASPATPTATSATKAASPAMTTVTPAPATTSVSTPTSSATPSAAPAANSPQGSPVGQTSLQDATNGKSAAVESSPESKNSDTLLQEAKVLYNEKEYKEALNRLNEFFEIATTKQDQGLFLQGQILEAKSEVQDIKAAIEAYSKLTKNYPASSKWDDANKRIIYLKRFYLEVR